jgi:hypothetical protein
MKRDYYTDYAIFTDMQKMFLIKTESFYFGACVFKIPHNTGI